MLALQHERYAAGEKHLSRFDMIKALTAIKSEYGWLYHVSNGTLQRACTDLEIAYSAFFKRQRGFPKFKSRKKARPAFPVRDGAGAVWFSETHVQIPKVGKVSYKTNYSVPLGREQKFSNPRIALTNGKWILTVGIEFERQEFELTDKAIGIDLGVRVLAAVAHGDELFSYGNINKSRRMRRLEKRRKSLERSVARKREINGVRAKTSNIAKQERKIAGIHARQANIRRDYTHKVTTALANLLPYAVTMEDLNVAGMLKNRHLSKAISEQAWSEFIRQMRYKCEWRGIRFEQVDRFYPSSKTCSHCGCVNKALKLSDEVYVCPECGYMLNRDYNAAINLMRYVNQEERLTA